MRHDRAEREPSWPDPARCTVEVLVVPGCPGTELAVARVTQATDALGVETNLRFVTVEAAEQARSLGFVGSPTVRVDGEDVEPGASTRPASLSCRLYDVDGAVERAPSLALIQGALARARTRRRCAGDPVTP